MALKQSNWALGLHTAVRPQTAGAVHVQKFVFEVSGSTGALAIGDIVEIGEIPPYAIVCDAQIFCEGVMTGVTADVGLMSGEYGDNDPARTSGNQLFAAADLTTFTRMSKPDLALLPHSELSRGIGVKIAGAAAAAAAGKRIHLALFYRQ